jgi:predicted Zn finger-like uncharacterized protein
VKISCPTCAAKYSVADDKIQSRLAKIRCRKCSSTIVIDGTVSPASVYIGDAAAAVSGNPPGDLGAPEPAPGSGRFGGLGFTDPTPGGADAVGPAADEYAVDIADNDQRNMTIHQIVGAYNEGIITADTYIWKEGMPDWQTLAEVREVAAALHAAARTGGGVAATPAAVRRPDHGPAADLFGGIDRAGGEDDITTSAPDAAPGFSAATAGTGARNESSVLFSLSALTGTEAAPSGGGSGKRGGRSSSEDSGLIDLQALTSAEANASMGGYAGGPVGGAYGASPLIGAPLGGVSGPALGGGLGGNYGRSSGGRLGYIIGAVVLGACIIGATMFVLKGSGDTEPTSALDPASGLEKNPAVPDQAPAVSPEPTNAEAKLAEPGTPKEPAEAAGEAGAAAAPAPEETAKPVATRPKVRQTPRPKPQAAPEPEPEPAPKPAATPRAESTASGDDPPKKKKEKKPCECKPSDLLCAMRCSAKK